MNHKWITGRQASFAVWFLGVQNLLIVPLFFVMAYLAGASESARMQDSYTPSAGEKIIEGALLVLVAPYALAKQILPASGMTFLSNNPVVALVFNAILTGLFWCACFALFNRAKSRRHKHRI